MTDNELSPRLTEKQAAMPGRIFGERLLLFRYTALRILERERVKNGNLRIRTLKTGKPVCLLVKMDLQFALDALPVPRLARN